MSGDGSHATGWVALVLVISWTVAWFLVGYIWGLAA